MCRGFKPSLLKKCWWTFFVMKQFSQHSKVATKLDRVEVKRGDTLDFVTDCRGSENTDGFQWSPVIKFVSETPKVGGEPRVWNAKTDFSGPAKPQPKSLGAWEKYAQVLLLANELVFVD